MLVICGMDKTHNWHGKLKLADSCYTKTAEEVGENANYVIESPCVAEDIERLLARTTKIVVAVVVVPLSLQIASGLAERDSHAINSITEETTKLLRLQARNRRRLLLVPYTSLSSEAHIRELPEILHGLSPTIYLPIQSTLFNALGVCAVTQDKTLQKLDRKLFASACGSLQADEIKVDVEALVAEHYDLKSALEDQTSECSILQEKIQHLKEQHEATINKLEALQLKYAETVATSEELTSANNEKLRSLEDENSVILQQLQQAQEELENNTSKLEGVHRELAESQKAHKELSLTSNEEIKALKEENKVILEQLLQVQSELELKVTEYKDLNERYSSLVSTTESQRIDYEKRQTEQSNEIEVQVKANKKLQSEYQSIKAAIEEQQNRYQKEVSELHNELKERRTAIVDLEKSQGLADKNNKGLIKQLDELKDDHEEALTSRDSLLAKQSEQLSKKNKTINELSSDIRKLNRELKDVEASRKKQLKEQHQKHTLQDKQRSREIIKLEQQLSDRADKEHILRKELAELRAATKSPYWKLSKKLQRLGGMVDKSAPEREQMLHDISLLYTSELFDADWYLNTYKDVAVLQVDPAEHYLLYGAAEGRHPSQTFDGNWYLKRYPDVADSNTNPLLHYIKHGREEGREVSPLMITHSKLTR